MQLLLPSDDEKLLRLPHVPQEVEEAAHDFLAHYEDCENGCTGDDYCPAGQRLHDAAFAAIERLK